MFWDSYHVWVKFTLIIKLIEKHKYNTLSYHTLSEKHLVIKIFIRNIWYNVKYNFDMKMYTMQSDTLSYKQPPHSKFLIPNLVPWVPPVVALQAFQKWSLSAIRSLDLSNSLCNVLYIYMLYVINKVYYIFINIEFSFCTYKGFICIYKLTIDVYILYINLTTQE